MAGGCAKGVALADQRSTTRRLARQFSCPGPSHCLSQTNIGFPLPQPGGVPFAAVGFRSTQSPFEGRRARLASGRNQRLPFHLEPVAQIESKFTAPCKSALVVAPVPDDPSCIEPGSARGFPLAKISERGFRSNRKRSNIVPRRIVTGRPQLLARQLRYRQSQDRCKASSDYPSPSR